MSREHGSGEQMSGRVTVSGTVRGTPRVVCTDDDLTVVSFLLRPNPPGGGRLRPPPGVRRGQYLVTAIDELAKGVAADVDDGDLLVVAGTLDLRENGAGGELVAELHAEAIGLDVRTAPRPGRTGSR
jgi:hypothetical protein